MIASPGTSVAPLLVVEDDRDLREVLSVPSHRGLRCARGGGRRRRSRAPALVILDLVMPRMGGRQLLAAMRGDGALAAIPVVLVTGTPPLDLRREVDAILKKPIGIEDLLACIRRRVDAGRTNELILSAGVALSRVAVRGACGGGRPRAESPRRA